MTHDYAEPKHVRRLQARGGDAGQRDSRGTDGLHYAAVRPHETIQERTQGRGEGERLAESSSHGYGADSVSGKRHLNSTEEACTDNMGTSERGRGLSAMGLGRDMTFTAASDEWADADAGTYGDTLKVAVHGVSGHAGKLPYLDQIQRAFGHHDVRGVHGHRHTLAREACHALGAKAYTTAGQVAFGERPDLRTAAHEAAHVVQQRTGVLLKGGTGVRGDIYERNADEVAEAVVRDRSAEHLLNRFADPTRRTASTGPTAVQLLKFPDMHTSNKGGYMRGSGDDKELKRIAAELIAEGTDQELADGIAYLEHSIDSRSGNSKNFKGKRHNKSSNKKVHDKRTALETRLKKDLEREQRQRRKQRIADEKRRQKERIAAARRYAAENPEKVRRERNARKKERKKWNKNVKRYNALCDQFGCDYLDGWEDAYGDKKQYAWVNAGMPVEWRKDPSNDESDEMIWQDSGVTDPKGDGETEQQEGKGKRKRKKKKRGRKAKNRQRVENEEKMEMEDNAPSEEKKEDEYHGGAHLSAWDYDLQTDEMRQLQQELEAMTKSFDESIGRRLMEHGGIIKERGTGAQFNVEVTTTEDYNCLVDSIVKGLGINKSADEINTAGTIVRAVQGCGPDVFLSDGDAETIAVALRIVRGFTIIWYRLTNEGTVEEVNIPSNVNGGGRLVHIVCINNVHFQCMKPAG